MTDLEIIPQHEPEIIAAAARKHWCGDDEKVATTSIDLLIVHGVKITSRYGKAHEFEVMRAMILAMPLQQGPVQSIFCDSKVGSCFSVVLRRDYWSDLMARVIANHFEKATIEFLGGHNGITVSADDANGLFGCSRRSVHFDAQWDGEDRE